MAKVSFSSKYKADLESYLSKTNVEMLMESKDYNRLNSLLERIYRRGTDTFEYEKAKQYKENYLKMLEGYENLDNYEEVKEKLESIDDKQFFAFIKEHDPSFDNLKDHYDNRMVQVEFNNFARDIGIDIDETYEPVTEEIF